MLLLYSSTCKPRHTRTHLVTCGFRASQTSSLGDISSARLIAGCIAECWRWSFLVCACSNGVSSKSLVKSTLQWCAITHRECGIHHPRWLTSTGLVMWGTTMLGDRVYPSTPVALTVNHSGDTIFHNSTHAQHTRSGLLTSCSSHGIFHYDSQNLPIHRLLDCCRYGILCVRERSVSKIAVGHCSH